MPDTDPDRPLSILLWNEPHPIRNSYTEHLHVSRMLLSPLDEAVQEGRATLRVFSNDAVIDQLTESMPRYIGALQRPTNEEARAIAAQFGQWDEAAIGRWLDLVRGKGKVTDLYLSILERLHAEQAIDVVLLWSENGAVRRFARDHAIPVLHGELGPTRAPYPETMYFDAAGTNGNAAFRAAARDAIEEARGDPRVVLPSATWLVSAARGNPTPETRPDLVDLGVTYLHDRAGMLPPGPYLFAPLQLADDLNTLVHSEFGSPLDFVRHVAGLARDNGYGLVVKGHPGVRERAYNLRREIEALDWLEDEMPEAVILPRDCGPEISAHVMANAAYTVSINSSVGFESMIQGVPALVLGQAAFDAGGWLQENVPLRPVGAPRAFGPELDALVSVYMDRVLVPREIVLGTQYLPRRLAELAAGADRPLGAAPHAAWHVIGDGAPPRSEAPDLPRRPALGGWRIGAGDRIIWEDGAAVFVQSGQRHAQVVPLGAHVRGYVETIDPQDGGDRIVGWALEGGAMRPAQTILMIDGDRVVSRHRVMMARHDVAEAFPKLARVPHCGFQFVCSGAAAGQRRLMVLTHDGRGMLMPNLGAGMPISPRVKVPW